MLLGSTVVGTCIFIHISFVGPLLLGLGFVMLAADNLTIWLVHLGRLHSLVIDVVTRWVILGRIVFLCLNKLWLIFRTDVPV